MTKFYKLSIVALMTVLLLPLWQSSELKAWVPHEKYAKWVRTFAVDKVWEFDNAESGNGSHPRLVDHPGTIAWCFMSWDERTSNSDDYNMDWFKLYLSNTSHSNYKRIATIDINTDDDNNPYPCSIDNANNCKTWCVQARWYSQDDGCWFLYMVTEYSSDVRQFIQDKGSNLVLNVETRWDDKHWNNYDEYSGAVDAADRTFLSQTAPSATNAKWVVRDGKTALQYTRTVPANTQLRVRQWVNNSLHKTFGYENVNAGTSDVYLYPFDGEQTATQNISSLYNMTYQLDVRRIYKANQSYYSYHGGATNCPAEHTIYSSVITLNPLRFAQPANLSAKEEGDGTITLKWTIPFTDGDNSDFIVERSFNADFSQIARTDKVAFNSKITSYTYTDQFDNRNQGEKNFYYRVHREHAVANELNATCTKIVNTNYTSVAKVDASPTTDGNITISWELNNGIWDASTMQLQITCNNEVLKTYSTPPAQTTYTTSQSLPSCTPLTFAVRVLVNSGEHSSEQAVAMLPDREVGVILDMQPSCGYFNDHVAVKWKTDATNNNFKYFLILRSEYGTDASSTESLGTVDAVNGVTEYGFEDRSCVPGTYYLYSVRGYSMCDDKVQEQTSVSQVGFAQPFGVISGQITYSGNQGVNGATVHAVGDNTRRGYSLYLKKERNPQLLFSADLLAQLFGTNAGTIEFYQKRDGETAFRHMAVTYQNNNYTTYINGEPQPGTTRPTWLPAKGSDWNMAIYNDEGQTVSGFIDEIRFWNIYRDSADIVRTMKTCLNGGENGLTAYYRCDDAVSNHLFDISRTGNNYNAHHITISNIILDESNTPTTEQLSLRAFTDDNGHYLITNVPYSVNGSLYNIIPTLGIHEFNPSSRPLFFNSDASTHNSIDFTDVSSFPVSGYVYYEGTDYPVEGCNFYVDGNACTMDNTIIESAADGSFTISVPIGNHYIEVRKANHTFVLGGRYPEAVAGKKTTFNFQQPVNNLTFYDNTLVTLTGRVAGGTEQQALPHGMQQGKANIGQARIVISPETKDKYHLNTLSNVVRDWTRPDQCDVASHAFTPINQGRSAMRVVILTDPMTGEFSVQLPPIDMTVDSLTIPSDINITFDLGSFDKMELSKVGDNHLKTDSVRVDSTTYRYFKYTAALDAIYRVNPELILSDTQYDNGMVGVRQYMISDPAHDTVYTVNIFEYDSLSKQWKYNFEVPYFLQGNTYVWHLRGFEPYANRDNPAVVVYDSVPLGKSIVTLYNQIGVHEQIARDTVIVSPDGDSIQYHAGDVALEVNQVQLDSVTGCAFYRFNAGNPIKTEPYRLGLTITYTDSKQTRSYDWAQNGSFQGVVLGAVSEGNNFVTEGPDHVIYVLRDPPGGGSYATLKAGTKTTDTDISTKSGNWSDGTEFFTSFGVDTKVGTGLGVMVIQNIKAKDQLTTSAEYHGHREHVHKSTTTYTTSRDISTESDVYHVGSVGDVYIGYSTNRTFGEATQVTLLRDPDGTVHVGTKSIITVGERFKTDFTYSQLELETTQIPNLKKLRNALLETVTVTEYNNPPENTGKTMRYITTLTPESSQFGAKGTYKALEPINLPLDAIEQDMVLYYNCQIDAWIARMSDNERAKVGKWSSKGSKLLKNVSVDGGVTLTESVTEGDISENETVVYHGFNVYVHNKAGFSINGTGEEWSVWSKGGGDWGDGDADSKTTDTITSYTFDLNAYEQLSVNVYDAGDGCSPVFSIVGGQTACPYEGEEKTKYYEPGQYTLNVATQKMEDPLLHVVGASAYSAIPVGGKVTYSLQLSNQSVVTSPVNLRLRLMEESNPNGAEVQMDGLPLNAEGVLYHFTGDKVINKTLTIKQGKADVLDYQNIGIILSSDCTPRSVADTVYVSATFIAACSDITLTTDTRIVNAERGGKLPMTISGYNVNLPTLTGCRLQYKQPMENSWHLIQEFNLEEMKNGTVHYTWDMSAINDGSYEVRAVTVCDIGGQEACNESETIAIVKDVTSPETLGLPSPINGIYTVDNQIYVDFNKDIQPGFITNACVDVSGVLNAHEQTHSVGLLYDEWFTYTQAEYDLSNTSFAFETWLNWTEAGVLLYHTMEGLQMEITKDDHLLVIIDSLQWVSKQTLPKDKWIYLLFNYDLQSNGTGLMSAHCAFDDQTIDLFINEPMPAYDRRGMVIWGLDLKGKMHDAILWNKSRDWSTALGERNIGKDAYTDGILSYWPMDEGEGMIAHDIVRHRDMTLLAENMWWYNNENKALNIPAGAEAIIDFSRFPYTFGNDYMFSFWFRTMAENETPFFRTSNGSLSFRLYNNEFIVETMDGTIRLNAGCQLNDGAWHHFAISSSHSFSPIILIDGEARNIATMDRQVFVTNEICLNDTASSEPLEIDEICVWKANCSSNYITNLYRNELRGNESGLQAYFPMQETLIDDYGQTVTRFTLADKQLNYPAYSKDLIIRNSNKDTLAATEAMTVPPIREARPIEKVKHTYTASERRIVINITEEARRIEGCTLDLTVKDIVDVYGNYSTPINWSVYVNRNQLLWDEENIRIVKNALNDTTFEVTIINNSGKTENWRLYNVPDWLTFDVNGGVLQPLSSRTLTGTISSALPIGNNQKTIYLIGNEGVNQPLYLSVKVNAEQPDWKINPADYEYSMNMVALATINGHMADDSEDKLAAFINGELVGVGSSKLFPAYNTYLIMMDIYANLNDKQRDSINHGVKIHLPVTFKYWDASTGIVYNRMSIQMNILDTPVTSIDYLPGQIIGAPNSPVQLTSNKYIEQTLSLTTGWNWISFNVLPDNSAFTAILNNVLDSLSLIKSQTTFAQVNELRHLVGSLEYMDAIKAYKCRMSQPCNLTVSGQIPNPAYLGIPLAANGWSWVGYLPQTMLSVDAALANLYPSTGDIIKARSGFATWDGYKWVGSLTVMAPGNGYLYYNSDYSDAILYYPSFSMTLLAPARLSTRHSSAQQRSVSIFNPIDPTTYQGNMTITAVVKNGEQIVEDAEVGIFAGDECRAAAVEKEGYWFITIPGEKSVDLTIKVATGGEIKTVKQNLTYVDDAMIGSPIEPYVIQLDEKTGLEEMESQGEDSLMVNKVLQNGILYIKRNSKIYTAQGQLIE